MSLQLASNQLTGPVSFLWTTPVLKELDLSGNRLSGGFQVG
jgi:hypothetical protein